MKREWIPIIIASLLLILPSCGGDDDSNVVPPHHRPPPPPGHRPPPPSRCTDVVNVEGWRKFVEQVKKGHFFKEPRGNKVTFYEQKGTRKNPKCGQVWGIFEWCVGISYDINTSFQRTLVDRYNHPTLTALVTPRPANFQGYLCNGKIVRAQIGVHGKGGTPEKMDLYRFDFTVPMAANPVFEATWESDRKSKIIERFYGGTYGDHYHTWSW